ncbi:MAG: DNA cytosine methyltransferase [Anaerotignum sp.]|nr:DNA cytosine methyltransferase [Anaerotignum sp.]
MKVLSLFDGISCGMVAAERAGIKVDRYVAFEIEKNAITISKKNYPQIEHMGDVTKADFTQYKGFDLMMGGSPCTNWSCNKNHNAKVKKELFINEGVGWELFMQYKRALVEAQPTYFIYENNYRISQNIVDEITNQLGVEPIMIDSALVSAQTRKRLYWTNIPNVEQPSDKGILIKDVFIEDKSLVRTDERILSSAVRTKNYIKYDLLNKGHYSEPYRLYYLDGKMKTLPRCRTETKCNVLLNYSDLSTYKILSPIEAERYQTLPDNYTEGIPKTRRFEAIGNGWTVEVIVHILSYIKEKEKNKMQLKMNDYQLPEKNQFNYEELKQ